MNCANKKIYPNKQMADKAAYLHNKDLFKEDEDVSSYQCKRHRGWHIGHPSNYENNPIARIHQILDKEV